MVSDPALRYTIPPRLAALTEVKPQFEIETVEFVPPTAPPSTPLQFEKVEPVRVTVPVVTEIALPVQFEKVDPERVRVPVVTEIALLVQFEKVELNIVKFALRPPIEPPVGGLQLLKAEPETETTEPVLQ